MAIRIEEDCWFGQCSAVMPGMYIGRGAIICANSVITRNVAPYEVHGSIPNHKIGERLNFSPPDHVNALSDRCLPYFYRGFHISQAELEYSRRSGVVSAGQDACLVPANANGKAVRLEGMYEGRDSGLTLDFSINGQSCGVFSLALGYFNLTIPVPMPNQDVPKPLRDYTVVELRAVAQTVGQFYGLSSAKLVA